MVWLWVAFGWVAFTEGGVHLKITAGKTGPGPEWKPGFVSARCSGLLALTLPRCNLWFVFYPYIVGWKNSEG